MLTTSFFSEEKLSSHIIRLREKSEKHNQCLTRDSTDAQTCINILDLEKGMECTLHPTFEDNFTSQTSSPNVQSSITNLLYHNILSTKVKRPKRMQGIVVKFYNQTNDLKYEGTMMHNVHTGLNILLENKCDGSVKVTRNNQYIVINMLMLKENNKPD